MKIENKDFKNLIRCSKFYHLYMTDEYTCDQLNTLILEGFNKLKNNISDSNRDILEEQMKASALAIHDKNIKERGKIKMNEEEIRNSMDYKIFSTSETSIEDLEKLIENLNYVVNRDPNLLNDSEKEIVKFRISAIELVIADRNTKKRN